MKRFLTLLRFLLCLLFLLQSSYAFSEVALTDEEATELMNEIQESKKDLMKAKEQVENLQNQLNQQEVIWTEQSQFYREQLTEAEKKKNQYKTATIATGSSTAILLVVLIVLLI